MSKSITGWEGAFGLYQDYNFAELMARHHRLKVIDLDGLLVLQKQFPIIGSMGCMLGGPEQTGSFEQWWPKLDQLHFSHILIQTNDKLDPLQSSCTSPADNCNMVVCLPDAPEKLLTTFQKRKQRTIKKATSKNQLTIAQVCDTEQLSVLHHICQQTSKNGQLFAVQDFALLKDLWESYFAAAFIALHEGTIVGGTFYLLSQQTMHALIGGVSREFMRLNAWDILHYHSMCWGIAHGYQYYDMGDQSPIQQPDITSYKMRFRPENIPCYHYKIVRSRSKYFLAGLKNRFL